MIPFFLCFSVHSVVCRKISCNNSGLSQEITGSHPSPLTYLADTSHSGIRPPERYGLQVLKFFPGQRIERAFRGMIQCIRNLSGGGRNLHQAQRIKRKIGGGKIPFLLSPQRKTAAILEKRKGIPFFVVPVCRRGRGELITSPTHTPCESMPLSPQSTPLKRVAHAGSILPNPG